MEENSGEAPKGRGRGRGGGVPLLPTGIWESLQNAEQDRSQKSSENIDQFIKSANLSRFEDAEPHQRSHHEDKVDTLHKNGSHDHRGKEWNCPSCTNNNWAWRTNCNMCGTPKPFISSGNEIDRNGYGGGFNERQDRVSAATVEVDEEGFDDFGRRVKKEKAAADRKAKEEAALKRLQDKYKFLSAPDITYTSSMFSEKSSVRSEQKEDRQFNGASSGKGPSTKFGSTNAPRQNRAREESRKYQEQDYSRKDQEKSRRRSYGRDEGRNRGRNESRDRGDSYRRPRSRSRSR